MKKIYLLFLFFLFVKSGFGYSYLTFSDPRQWGKSGNATIEEASVSIKPSGVFFQCDLLLSFSTQGYNYTEKDTFEIVYYFDMPPNVAFTDSWLWVGDSAVQAGIYDIATATNTYEKIVNRRKDPSILYKRANNQYELRIFPVAGNEIRKVKLSYLVPVQWNLNNVTLPFNTNIFTVSAKPLNSLNIHVDLNESFGFPQNLQSDEFVDDAGDYIIKGENISKLTDLVFSNPMKNGIYFGTFNSGKEKYFQTAILPSYFLPVKPSKKVIIGIDYDTATTNFKKEEVLNSIKTKLINSVSSADSFLIIYNAKNKLSWSNSTWSPANPENVSEAFKTVSENLGHKSNVMTMVSEVYKLSAMNNSNVNFLLISGGPDVNNAIPSGASDTLVKYAKSIPTYISAIGNKIVRHYYEYLDYYGVKNNYYYDYSPYSYNYELSRLASFTGGLYLNAQNYYYYYSGQSGNNESVANYVNNNNTIFKYFEDNSGTTQVFPVLENGFAYSVFSLNDNSKSGILKPYTMVGKISGELPVTFYLTSEIGESAYFNKIEVKEFADSDSLVKTMWAAVFIKNNEDVFSAFNPKKSEVIKVSLANRVLSIYTAFLALEPGMTVEPCSNCNTNIGGPVAWPTTDGFILTPVVEKEIAAVESDVIAAPNPFTESTEISLASLEASSPVNIKIYNSIGELILDYNTLSNEVGSINYKWNGLSASGVEVKEGVYNVIVTSGKKKKSTRIVLVK